MTSYLSDPSPRYTPQDVELARFDSASPSTLTAPPPYDEAAAASFRPAVHFQIETPGKPWFSLPFPPRPVPIPVFALHPEDPSSSAASHVPQFISVRPERCSGSCYLISADGTSSSPSSEDTIPALSTTTYRFGPNRPPRICLFAPTSPALAPSTLRDIVFPPKDKSKASNLDLPTDDDDAAVQAWDSFTVTSLGLLTRAVSFRTRLGTFQWRYASRRERRQALSHFSSAWGPGQGGLGQQQEELQEISSLLVLERVVRVAKARNLGPDGGSGDDDEIRTVVAHFLRGPGLRTPGSSASSAGNGGRLVMDLALWEDGDAGSSEASSKLDREMAAVMVVTTCLVMLKREVDRRRAQQMAIMAGAASGGGP